LADTDKFFLDYPEIQDVGKAKALRMRTIFVSAADIRFQLLREPEIREQRSEFVAK
jgi:hypothetical protein